jgi:hypothetical protein
MNNPMRATIIPSDGFCSVDGVAFNGVDMTSVAAEVHAVQWYGAFGEVEIIDPVTGKAERVDHITDLNSYQNVFSSYWGIRNAIEAAQQEHDAEQTIIEV